MAPVSPGSVQLNVLLFWHFSFGPDFTLLRFTSSLCTNDLYHCRRADGSCLFTATLMSFRRPSLTFSTQPFAHLFKHASGADFTWCLAMKFFTWCFVFFALFFTLDAGDAPGSALSADMVALLIASSSCEVSDWLISSWSRSSPCSSSRPVDLPSSMMGAHVWMEVKSVARRDTSSRSEHLSSSSTGKISKEDVVSMSWDDSWGSSPSGWQAPSQGSSGWPAPSEGSSGRPAPSEDPGSWPALSEGSSGWPAPSEGSSGWPPQSDPQYTITDQSVSHSTLTKMTPCRCVNTSEPCMHYTTENTSAGLCNVQQPGRCNLTSAFTTAWGVFARWQQPRRCNWTPRIRRCLWCIRPMTLRKSPAGTRTRHLSHVRPAL